MPDNRLFWYFLELDKFIKKDDRMSRTNIHAKLENAENEGLYNSAFEHDSCGTGFVANIKGVVSHDLINQGLTILDNLAHRGATGSESDTGDGAGVLIQIPHKFFQRVSAEEGFALPGPRYYGVGMLYLPQEETIREEFERLINQIVEEEGQRVLGWRTVPTDDAGLAPLPKRLNLLSGNSS